MRFDPTVGLFENRLRSYDPDKGRWIERDPIGFAAGDTNVYRYVGNQPTNHTDPSGAVWSFVVTFAFFAWDTYQERTGGISPEEYNFRLRLNATILIVDFFAGGGFTGGGQGLRLAVIGGRTMAIGVAERALVVGAANLYVRGLRGALVNFAESCRPGDWPERGGGVPRSRRGGVTPRDLVCKA